MNRQMILMALVSSVIILLLIIPALERPKDEQQPANEGAEVAAAVEVETEPTSKILTTGEIDKMDQIPPLNAYLEPATGGMRLVLDEEESPYVNSVAEDAMGGLSVHLVEREVDSGSAELGWVKQYNLVAVRPDSAQIDTYTLYTEKAIDHSFYPIVKLLNEQEAMFISRSKEGDAIEYQLAVVHLGNGRIRTMPSFWRIHSDNEDERDFLLSTHYESNEEGHISEVMLTSYEGKRWQMDMESFKLIGHRGQTYPATGDAGSGGPPRPLMYPTPDLERFAYSFTEKDPIYISNHFLVADSKSGKVIKLFSIDDSMQLSDSGLVWNKESSRFFLEYAKKGEEMGVGYDSGPVVFAQQIAFYDSNGERTRVLHAAKGERLSVYNWLDEHRLLVESYRPVQRASGGWSKGDIVYKEYDVRTGKLTAYRKEQDAGKLANGETVTLRTAGGTYDSKAFVYVDHKNKKIWTPDVKGRTHQSGGQLYIDVSDADMQQYIFEWDDEAKSLRLVYSTSSSEQQLRQALGDWLMLEERGESSFLYLNTKPKPELNEEGLPVFSGELARLSGNEWWNENRDTIISLPGNEIRAQVKSRYGTLRIRSSEGELEHYKGARQYYGRYEVEFTNNASKKISLPSLEKVALELGRPVGEMKVLSFDGFDLILFVTHQRWFGKSYDGEFTNVYAYAATEDGRAMPLTFRYASPGGIQLADSIVGMVDTETGTGSSVQSATLQSYMGEKRVELVWTADVKTKTLTLTGLKDRTKEYDSIRTIVERYANRLEQALGLTDIALPEGKMDKVKLRSLFTEKAWNNPGFQRLKTDFAKLEKAGTPSRAFAWQPINARYDEHGNIRVTFTFNLFYAVGWAAHLEAILKLDEYEWTFHDFGMLETEYQEGYKELDDNLGMKGYNGLIIPDALER
ncbi:hypothetical protein D3P07_14805 [Paenibacillus sp. 1011MAR3C5]|uniref:hypothetical protein n=1 Tax=Paenibacillus sp. 1011MAR3C5 TaxID=1675787 RepID=UPI000E6BD11F|nr:hypothetical protein [Paenibacillus sp. 1011MAR3C5]RJE87585.1 hypothetical protein D3P07_14805 [Paenibacillus sp. 1011MAR3C5]